MQAEEKKKQKRRNCAKNAARVQYTRPPTHTSALTQTQTRAPTHTHTHTHRATRATRRLYTI